LGWDIDRLLRSLVDHAKRSALPPISDFYVGAAALGASGDVYLGVNIEFPGAAIGQTVRLFARLLLLLFRTRIPAGPVDLACRQVHGEQCLVTIAAQHKETALERLAVSAAPCGHCRQFLNETNQGGEIAIGFDDVRLPLRELLPHSFGPDDLGNDTPLLRHKRNTVKTLEIPPDADDALVSAACEAAAQSYSPYTRSPSGVAVRLSSGEVFAGSYLENCAFNPAVPPLQAALINMVSHGRGHEMDQIVEVVLVEDCTAPIQQSGGAMLLLAGMFKEQGAYAQVATWVVPSTFT